MALITSPLLTLRDIPFSLASMDDCCFTVTAFMFALMTMFAVKVKPPYTLIDKPSMALSAIAVSLEKAKDRVPAVV